MVKPAVEVVLLTGPQKQSIQKPQSWRKIYLENQSQGEAYLNRQSTSPASDCRIEPVPLEG